MRVWIDISNSPQVPFFRPLIALLEARGQQVEVTTRDYAQTLELLRLHGIEHSAIGPPHGGAGTVGKGRSMAGRVRALRRFAASRGFDIALSHASHELPLVARSLGIPSAYAFDYEFARTQHGLGCRAARRVIVPEAIPQDRLDPDETVLDELAIDRDRVLVVVRTPPEVSLYHRHGNTLFADVVQRLGRDPGTQAVVLPRTEEQRRTITDLDLPSLVLPRSAVDAQSLVALSDLVVSAGGTMNREAVALGVPVYTTFGGRLGAVDETLIAEKRLRLLRAPSELELEKRAAVALAVGRDPAMLLDLMLTALEA